MVGQYLKSLTIEMSLFEYIWLDSKNDFRSKTKVIDVNLYNNILEQLPIWNYDGSSTGQVEGKDLEVFLKPVAIFRDPFRPNHSAYLVWCEMVDKEIKPLKNSNRTNALKVFEKFESE
jgi:glutamine synthetase